MIGWIIGILFPFGWLTRYCNTYRQVFDAVFGPLWVHILMHAVLYAGLAYLLAGLWPRHRSSGISQYFFGLLFVLILAIAVGQEGLQLLYQSRPPGVDEWLDIAVDIAGGSLGLLISSAGVRRRSKA